MKSEFRIRPAVAADDSAVSRIAAACFDDSIRPFYGPDGASAFAAYIQPEAIRARHNDEDAALFVAERAGETVGVAELRERCHLSMLFVMPELQNCGIGRALLERVVKEARKRDGLLRELTVFAAPGAVRVYAHWGFLPTGELESVQGIRFVPMRLELK